MTSIDVMDNPNFESSTETPSGLVTPQPIIKNTPKRIKNYKTHIEGVTTNTAVPIKRFSKDITNKLSENQVEAFEHVFTKQAKQYCIDQTSKKIITHESKNKENKKHKHRNVLTDQEFDSFLGMVGKLPHRREEDQDYLEEKACLFIISEYL